LESKRDQLVFQQVIAPTKTRYHNDHYQPVRTRRDSASYRPDRNCRISGNLIPVASALSGFPDPYHMTDELPNDDDYRSSGSNNKMRPDHENWRYPKPWKRPMNHRPSETSSGSTSKPIWYFEPRDGKSHWLYHQRGALVTTRCADKWKTTVFFYDLILRRPTLAYWGPSFREH